jgi:hypothetical protein
MSTGSISILTAPTHAPVRKSGFRFELAVPDDNAELLRFSRNAEMPGAIRFSFDRSPDYLGALCVEGRQSEVLVCRETQTGRVVAIGHRSVKSVFVNGQPAPVGYLSGLRLDPSVRNREILAHGYAFLRKLHAARPAQMYLSTIMEDNLPAKAVLLSGRGGLPGYHDFGRFCCMAVRLPSRSAGGGRSGIRARRASAADGPAIIGFLNREGRSRQFFPEYQVEDFGAPGGLLSHLPWEDVFLAFRGDDLIGVVAAWDQRAFRQWRVTGYSPWLGLLRIPFNLVAKVRKMPLLPKPALPLDYFILSLACVRGNDRSVFKVLLEEVVRKKRRHYAFFLAGLHERDPLLPELLARPHFPLPSRLYAVAWDEDAATVQKLDRELVPYLELGSL